MTHPSQKQSILSPARLDQLRRDAKRRAKAQGIRHTEALDQIASAQGFTNWQLLCRAAEPVDTSIRDSVSENAAPAPAPPPTSERPVAHLPYQFAMPIRMDASRGEVLTIKAIVERYERLIGAERVDRLSTMMDLEACHCNGCPLDLTGLLDAASDIDLVHDVAGISRHLDRESGELVNFFRPRYSA